MIADLQELRPKIETAQQEWDSYLSSLQAEPLRPSTPNPDTVASIINASLDASIEDVDRRATSLRSRFDKLADRHRYLRQNPIGTVAELIGEHMPTHIHGSETANALVARALDSVEDNLSHSKRRYRWPN